MNPESPDCARALAAPGRLRRWRGAFLVMLGVFLGAVPPARAHRPTEATADFRWLHGRLEARVVLPLQMATLLLNDPEVVALRAENFPANRGKLVALAAEAFLVHAAVRDLRPTEIIVELDASGEVLATLLFPPTDPAPLVVEARFLHGVPNDCFCLLRVWHDADDLLLRRVLMRSAPGALAPAPVPSSPAP